MKKIFLAICLCCSIGLSACGNNSSSGSNGSAAFTDTSSNTGGNTATPAKQNGDSTIDSMHTAAHVPAASSGKTKNTNPDTTNASSH
jgi:hypothetical protein